MQLLAEKVEDHDRLAEFEALGFELFQGYALERPALITATSLEPGIAARLRMAATILTSDPDLDEVEQIVRADPALALQLIRVASVGRPGETRRAIGTSARGAGVDGVAAGAQLGGAAGVTVGDPGAIRGHDFVGTLILARRVRAARGAGSTRPGAISPSPPECCRRWRTSCASRPTTCATPWR